jgi:hypothetical protein
MRTIDAWQAEALARFRSAPVTAATYDEMAAAQKVMTERVSYAWPSDRKQTEVALEQIRNQVAGSGVTAMADRAVAAAASGMPGVKCLRHGKTPTRPPLRTPIPPPGAPPRSALMRSSINC